VFQKFVKVELHLLLSLDPSILMKDLRFSLQREFRLWSSGLLRYVDFWLCTNVSEDHAASIFRACFSEMLVYNQKLTRRKNPEDQYRNVQFCPPLRET
jgi:hypothetical protein